MAKLGKFHETNSREKGQETRNSRRKLLSRKFPIKVYVSKCVGQSIGPCVCSVSLCMCVCQCMCVCVCVCVTSNSTSKNYICGKLLVKLTPKCKNGRTTRKVLSLNKIRKKKRGGGLHKIGGRG